ncbi:hypothetical protein [Amycolatopsis benzoatilytica]|uniref:hypothetical protein n=1 Tax=Amycolatopsis benzoatilytica TaxID=346045 RepID=UPI0003742C4B|nr:hypothetical protein [Amycolatopsis benzoatilytica]
MNQPAPHEAAEWLPGPGFTITDDDGAAGPGFTMSHDDARNMLNLAKQARDQFDKMRVNARALTQTTSPADEPASTSYTAHLVGDGQTNGAFGGGLANVQRMYDYASELVAKLEKALGLTQNTDEAAAKDIEAAGRRSAGRPR